MKGVVFTEFLEMVEDKFSPELADSIIEEADLPSGGVYTSVGTYDHEEMIRLVENLAGHSGTSVPDLLRAFGHHLFLRFHEKYPAFFERSGDAFAFLMNVDNYIHVEVRKLYPDAELPTFECDASQPDHLNMTYRSTRPFAALAEGLIRGCVAHFGESIDMEIEDLSGGKGTAARFSLSRPGATS